MRFGVSTVRPSEDAAALAHLWVPKTYATR
jgi:hypothetical protein